MHIIQDNEKNTTSHPRVSGVQSGVMKKGLDTRYLCDDAYKRAVFSFKTSPHFIICYTSINIVFLMNYLVYKTMKQVNFGGKMNMAAWISDKND